MTVNNLSRVAFRPSLSSALLCMFVVALCFAGGASRADAMGQVVVRSVAACVLVVTLLLGKRPVEGFPWPVFAVLTAALMLALLQLVPLPPSWWEALPGRSRFADLHDIIGQPQPWRPLALVPEATANAALSLIVPFAMLALVATMPAKGRAWLPGLLLGTVVISVIVGLAQFTGAGWYDPLVDSGVEGVSGLFANRNHFALFVALGCLMVPSWVFLGGRCSGWRGPVGIALVLLFQLTILAAGSRAGVIFGALALGIGIVLARKNIQAELRRYPRWVFFTLIAGIVGCVALIVVLSIVTNRAVSIDRMLAGDVAQDMRSRGLPTVLAMIREYFPFGSGLGGFDPLFRLHEPIDLLKPNYFNRAHNDFLEIVLDAGVFGFLLLLAGLGWWAVASVRAWRSSLMLPKLGSAILLLVIVASAFDYPARTPLIMVIMVVAGIWLSGPAKATRH